jgi:hypothetical protein
MNIEHVIQLHYEGGYPYSESHFLKIDDELILIGCNGYGGENNKYVKIADLIVKAVKELEAKSNGD